VTISHVYEPNQSVSRDLQLPSVVELLNRYIPEGAMVIDPYSGDGYERTTFSNSPSSEPFQLPATHHMGATAYMDQLRADYGLGWADAVILNPWGWHLVAYKPGKERLGKLLRVGGVAVTIGYSSCGFREVDWMGYRLEEVLVVCRGVNWVNDCIVVVERKER
jgi:hypothetical protein